MGKANLNDDFKRDAVAQIAERGYPVAEVSQRLGVSPDSLYAWKRKFSQPSGGDDKDAEIRRLKRELVRVTEERDILKLAVVIDLYSRRVVGWSLHSHQTTDVVLQALHMAVWRRKPKNRVPIHSDSQKIMAGAF